VETPALNPVLSFAVLLTVGSWFARLAVVRAALDSRRKNIREDRSVFLRDIVRRCSVPEQSEQEAVNRLSEFIDGHLTHNHLQFLRFVFVSLCWIGVISFVLVVIACYLLIVFRPLDEALAPVTDRAARAALLGFATHWRSMAENLGYAAIALSLVDLFVSALLVIWSEMLHEFIATALPTLVRRPQDGTCHLFGGRIVIGPSRQPGETNESNV
jgi:hypothetical protein